MTSQMYWSHLNIIYNISRLFQTGKFLIVSTFAISLKTFVSQILLGNRLYVPTTSQMGHSMLGTR